MKGKTTGILYAARNKPLYFMEDSARAYGIEASVLSQQLIDIFNSRMNSGDFYTNAENTFATTMISINWLSERYEYFKEPMQITLTNACAIIGVKVKISGGSSYVTFPCREEAEEKEFKAPLIDRAGYIYLVREESRGAMKIGKSVDINNRVKTFSVKMPFEISLEHHFMCNNYGVAEKKLHEYFNDKRMNGEWFGLSSSDIRLIKSPAFISSLGIEVII